MNHAGRVDVQISITQLRIRSKIQVKISKYNKMISYLSFSFSIIFGSIVQCNIIFFVSKKKIHFVEHFNICHMLLV